MMRWNSTKTYTEEDMLRMQQEAVNRVHEFQARAQVPSFYGEETPIGELPAAPPVIEAQSRVVEEPEPSEAPSAEEPQQPQPQQAHPQQPQQPFPQQNLPMQNQMHPQDPIKGLLDRFSLDSETLLIMGLMFVLYNEKADNTLLAALAYLLL